MPVTGDRPLDRAQRRLYLRQIQDEYQAHRSATETAPLPRLLPADADGARRGDSLLRLYNDASLRRVLTLLPRRPLRILDVGCGKGHYVEPFRQAGFTGHYHGVDIEPRPAWDRHRAVASPLQATYQAGEFETCPMEETDFDFIFSSSALEHIRHDDLAIRRMFDLTRPGGLGLHLVPSLSSRWIYGYHGYRRYDQQHITGLFQEAGFEIVSVERQGGFASLLLQGFWISFLESGHFRQMANDTLRDGGPDDRWRRALVGTWFNGMRRGGMLRPYHFLARLCLRFDHWLPARTTIGYALVVRKPV
jgi:2-polyprenyl-3-methyl-5-hydroxy-6-metoxy-1,4-benzoquinol methylase